MYAQQNGEDPPVHAVASLFQRLCYENKDALSAGIIVAGWDKQAGPSVYNIPLGGGMFQQPWAIGGSGSTYVYGYCDATYKEGWGQEETVEFVKNSKLPWLVRRRSGGSYF
jgi:20S proteasome subunit beta 1